MHSKRYKNTIAKYDAVKLITQEQEEHVIVWTSYFSFFLIIKGKSASLKETLLVDSF